MLVADCFYWGERRLQYAYPPTNYRQATAGLNVHSEQYISAVDDFLEQRTADLITLLGYNGLNWLGIVSYDDMRSVDLLLSLAEVDPHRIGCIGLSGGGFRSTYLAGRDARIRAAVIVAWMTTLPTTLDPRKAMQISSILMSSTPVSTIPMLPAWQLPTAHFAY